MRTYLYVMHFNAPARGAQEAVEMLHEGGFARASDAYDCGTGACLDAQANVVQCHARRRRAWVVDMGEALDKDTHGAVSVGATPAGAMSAARACTSVPGVTASAGIAI